MFFFGNLIYLIYIVKLRGIQKAIQQTKALDRPANNVTKLLIICGLLCQHFDFDRKRKEAPEKVKALDKITEVLKCKKKKG